MNLTELYAKVPVSKHENIKVVGNQVVYDDGTEVYDDGTEVYVAAIDSEGKLVALNKETKTVLKALKALK